MERDAFVFYRSFYDVVKMFPKREQNRMLIAIIELGLTDTIDETLPLRMRAALRQMQESVNSAQKRREINQKNGKKGGAPKGNQNASKKNNQNNPSVEQKTTENNLKEKENGKGNAKANTFSIRKGDNTSSGMAPLDEGQPSDDEEPTVVFDEEGWEDP